MERPPDMFDREYEWSALTRFVADTDPGATLGVVSGRRRQGKSFLLQSVCEVAGGFYFAATEATEAEALRRLSDEVGAFVRSAHPIQFSTWEAVVDSLLALGSDRPVPVVVDEFPYLCRANSALPSVVQRALGPRRRQRVNSRARLLLCGSAVSFMGGLLSGTAPLRGRAGLELTMTPFDYRTAAQFWGATDDRLAVQLHAIVGGTPAYRREFVRGDAPAGPDDFDAWVVRAVLDPASPLFKEGRHLLAEESDLRDRALYHSVLAAIAEGNRTRGGIANAVGRPADAVAHPLVVLEDVGMIHRIPDAFHPNRTVFRIAEPLIAFYHAVMRPEWGRLERPGSAASVWASSRARFRSLVVGPHFESLARSFVRAYCDAETLGGTPTWVRPGVLNDRAGRRTLEVDVVAARADGEAPPRLLALGEAEWGTVLGPQHLERLVVARELAGRYGFDTSATRLLLIGGAGFAPALRGRTGGPEDPFVELVDLRRL